MKRSRKKEGGKCAVYARVSIENHPEKD